MHEIQKDDRIVLTLDAGGTNFDFAAIRGFEEASEPIRLPSNGDDLNRCISTIKDGFSQLLSELNEIPDAISFAFPGPADYNQGIIGDLNNLPAFKGGVPLKSILEKEFKIPVYINNDANLFVYGEAIGGFLPRVNNILREAGNPKRYKNLIGVTLGTGFGGGLVLNGRLLVGDNSLGGEIWLTSSRVTPGINAEESISIRAIKKNYARSSGIPLTDVPSPKEIAKIAREEAEGNVEAAQTAFRELGISLGEVLANLITFHDSLIVIGGGIAYEHKLIFPSMMQQLKLPFESDGYQRERPVQNVFNLEDENERMEFVRPSNKVISWEGLEDMIYDHKPNLGIGVTHLGTRNATSIGAYAIALAQLDGTTPQ